MTRYKNSAAHEAAQIRARARKGPWRRLTAAMQRGDVVLTRIGRCTAERGRENERRQT